MTSLIFSSRLILWHSGGGKQKRLNIETRMTEVGYPMQAYGGMKLTDPSASPIIRRSFEVTIQSVGWKGDHVFHISTTVELEKEA